jgi:putative membrane protein
MMPSDTPPPVLPPVLDGGTEVPPPLPPDAFPAGRQLEGKLHPLTLVLSAWVAVRGLFLPILVALFASGRTSTGTFMLIFPALAVIGGLVRYLVFSYRLENGELITRDGIFSRTVRHIPLNRVQDIRIEQGVVHRLLKVADVHVETAGGKGAEASMSVLSRAEADRLRQAVFALTHAAAAVPATAIPVAGEGMTTAASAATPLPPADEVVRQLSLKELILAGLTSNRMASVFVIIFAGWNLVDDILPKDRYEKLTKFLVHEVEVLSHTETGMNWPVIIAAGIGAILLGAAISAIGSVILFHGFTLSRRGEDLHRTYGLLTRRSSSLPRKRIQLLKLEETWLRRLLKLVAVQADTAGNRVQNPEQKNDGRDVLLPILPKAELVTVLPLIVPDLDTTEPAWQQVNKCAIRRPVKKAFWFCLLASTILLAATTLFDLNTGLWMLLPMAFLPVVYLLSVLEYRNLGFALSEKFFRTRQGWLSRTTHLVPIRNTQVVVLRQSPFDRRYNVMKLQVDTAGQTFTGGGPHISNVTAEEALTMARTLSQRAARTRYRV